MYFDSIFRADLLSNFEQSRLYMLRSESFMFIDSLNQPTVAPLSWDTQSCGAHFFVHKGKLLWAQGSVVERQMKGDTGIR